MIPFLLIDAAKIVIIYYHRAAKYTISTKTNEDKFLISLIMSNIQMIKKKVSSTFAFGRDFAIISVFS